MTDDDSEMTLRMRPRGVTAARAEESGPATPAGGPAQLVILLGPDAGRRYGVHESLVIGRDAATDVVLRDDGASRRHAKILRDADGNYVVEDLGSRNGTFVNGEQVASATLAPGDKIAIGADTIFLFTRHDRYEQQVAQAQRLQALGQLASGIAHDFNNLVATILGNVTYLRVAHPAGDSATDDSLAEIETAARRAADLTTQLLSFARSRPKFAGHVELAGLIEEAAGLVRRTLPRNVTLHVDTDPQATTVGDSSMLLQVIMNACINAGQAMPDGGEVRISASRHPAEAEAPLPGPHVRVSVTDQGVGMDAKTMARAFQPFFTTKPRGQGTGLGLATVAAIVREHGGEVELHSAPGKGTKVVAYLPASNGGTAQRRPAPGRFAELTGRVLLFDSDSMVRSATGRLLERFGLEVAAADDQGAAADLVRDGGVDFAIVDLDEPTGVGQKIVDDLRKAAPKLPLVVCSGRSDAVGPDTPGAVGHLRKPFDVKALWRTAALALGGTGTTPE